VTRRESLRLGDIREAIATIERYLREATFDEKTGDAVLYNLVVIGEAANALSEETRKMEPAVRWSEIVGLRNLIAHEYFRIDREVVESIVREELQSLDEAAARLIEADPEGT
jgi:uncharacterized protein with HEPN domain